MSNYVHELSIDDMCSSDLTLEARLRPASEGEIKQYIHQRRIAEREAREKKQAEGKLKRQISEREVHLKASTDLALCPQCGNVTPVKDGEAIPLRRDGDGMWIPVGRCPHCKGIVWRKR